MSAYRQNYTPTRTPRWPEHLALACLLLALVSAGAWLLMTQPLTKAKAAAEAEIEASAYAAGQAAAREEMAASVAAAYAQGRADALREAGAQR